MLTRFALVFIAVSGSAYAASLSPQDGLVKGKTTVADVEQGLGAPLDTAMRPDGALTLTYTYGRCAHRLPASFPSVRGSDANSRTVALRFGSDFLYRGAAISNATSASAGDLAPVTSLAAK
jgi:hypothetical protein